MRLLLYADDSVEAQYPDGARLYLSPCGTEFMYEPPPAGGHPLQRPGRRRHRTEYVTSLCREQVLQALTFRNTFSCRPFLPSSLTAPEEIVTFMREISEVTWPALEDDTGRVTGLEDGGVKVSSLDGHAYFYMNALQKEVTVKFLCPLSSAPCAPKTLPAAKATGNQTTRNTNRSKYSSCVLGEGSRSCLTKHALQYTWLTQRFSVADCPQVFHYPMHLALHFHQKSIHPGDITPYVVTEEITTNSDVLEKTASALPRALPLTCTASHLHRLSFFKSSVEGEDVLAVNPLPLKVVFSDDILYRFILEGTNVVEIHPGDGSVFISEGDCMGKYFTQYFINEDTKRIEDRVYTARDLPPDKPRSPYSVRSIISQARRFLEFSCKHKLSIDPISHAYCWNMGSGPDSRTVVPVLLQQTFIPHQGRFSVYSNNTACASFVDGVLLYMIWNFANFNTNAESPDRTDFHKSSGTVRHEQFAWCCLRFPDGSSKLVEMENPGEHASYIKTTVSWCRWLDETALGEMITPLPKESDIEKGLGMVACELEKIQRFKFLLENSSATNQRNDRNDITTPGQMDNADGLQDVMGEMNIQAILEKTSKAIQDIDLLLSYRK